MFSRAFQSGSHLEVFDAKGVKDDKLLKINFPQSVNKTYDKILKSYVYDVEGSGKTRLTFPKDDRQELGLTQHFLVFQIFVPSEAPFCLEVIITDTLKNKRRLIFTNNLREIEKTHFHIKIPLDNIRKGIWLNLSFDLQSFFELFPASIFRTIDGFNISGDFRLKRVFTMKNPLSEFDSDHEPNLPYVTSQMVSKAINFNAGVNYSNQLITNLSMKNMTPEYKESPSRARFDESLGLKSSVSTPLLIGLRGNQQQSKSPDQARTKKRNISEHIEEIKKPKHQENRENSSMVSAQSRDTRKSYLLSTADSKRDMLISPKFGDKIQPRRFLSPKQDSSSLLKIHELTSKGRASEELATPKKFKIHHHETPSSKPHNLSLEEKKETPLQGGRTYSQSKAQIARKPPAHEALEPTSSKSSLLNRRVGPKKSQDPYLLVETASNPKFEVPTSKQNIVHSVRVKSTKNPWGESQSPGGVRTAGIKSNIAQKSPSTSKTPNKYKAKEIKTRTAAQTPKDVLCDSDRFSSTFNRSDYEQGWVINKDDGYDDDIESIEENLEYEMNSNNSVTYGNSPVVKNEDRIRQKSKVIETSGRAKKSHPDSHIDLYKAFIKRNLNDGDEVSRNIYGSYSKETNETNKIKLPTEEGKTQRIVKQVEDKVQSMLSNTRPYSPPFSSNLIISNRPEQQTVLNEQEGLIKKEKKLMEVEYDPVWDCYYNSKTDEYYQLKG